MPDYIEELNEGQRNAVLYNDGPSLVIAGAGSGKTRVLTYKIAYLLENGYQPWNILALTFTNKAAREMKERIARQVGPERARHLWMGTFHSMFLRILHVEAGYIGFTSQFTIYDTADSKSLIRSIIKEMGLDEKSVQAGDGAGAYLECQESSGFSGRLCQQQGGLRRRPCSQGSGASRHLPEILGALPAGRCDGLRRFAVLHIPAVPGPPRGVGALSGPVPLHSGR